MAFTGVALMLEQLSAARALDLAGRAEAAGAGGIMAADVLQPWVPKPTKGHEGRAPHMWNVLSAAGALTSGSLGAVITPHYRHHPLTIAHASATLADMYPGRHWLALSAGEALNDAAVAGRWPRAPERIAAVFEAADLISKLLTNSAAGRDTRFTGEHASVDSARLWTVPERLPDILIATAGPITARRAGRVADGFITMGNSVDKARTLVQRFDQGRTEAGKTPGGFKVARLHVSFANTVEAATTAALQNWPQAAMRFNTADIRSPFDFAQIARLVRPEDFEGNVLITTDPAAVADLVEEYRGLGFDEIHLHNVGTNDDEWFEVLPTLM